MASRQETTGGRYTIKVLTYRVSEAVAAATRNLSGPDEVATAARELIPDDDREHFGVLFVNTQNRLLAYHEVSTGTLSASLVHPRELFRAAVLAGAANLILVHNHPSGDVTPSREDLALTRQLKEAARLLGFALHDHVIIAHRSAASTSLAARGLL